MLQCINVKLKLKFAIELQAAYLRGTTSTDAIIWDDSGGDVARVFRIWGDLEIDCPWAFSGFWAISRWAKGVFRILKRPSPFQDLKIAQDIFEIAQGHFYD